MDDARRLFRSALRPPRAQRRYSLPEGERVYAVGDIHGRADLAKEMQGLIAAHAGQTAAGAVTVVWLGDYIDRGPCSRDVIDLLIDFAQGPYRSVFLMGNHEEAMLRFLADPAEGPQWCGFGGLETLASYGISADAFEPGLTYGQARSALIAALPPRHQDFFLSLRFSETIGDFFFCHAGVRPGIRLEEQNSQDLIWIRDEFLDWRHDFGKMIVHGHTPGREPELRHNRVNVDTLAFATGHLTCAVIEGSEIAFLST
jgi:serine/threonine protein phosphatase 1